jgi:hypothetical protein
VSDNLVSEIAKDLRLHGISVIPALFDPQQISRAYLAANEANLIQDNEGAKRILEDADKHDEFAFFFQSQVFSELFRRILGEDAISRRNRVQIRTDHGQEISPILLFHIDSSVQRYKVFLYLTDVKEDDGPLEYLRGTHVGAWRTPYLREVDEAVRANRDGVDIETLDYVGCLRSESEIELVTQSHELCRVLGPRGTCVIFDTEGFHRAATIQTGSRLLLSMDWVRAKGDN